MHSAAAKKGCAGSAWGSYTVVVHELGASTSQSVGQKLSCFNGCWSQLRTALKRKKKILTFSEIYISSGVFIIFSFELDTSNFSQMLTDNKVHESKYWLQIFFHYCVLLRFEGLPLKWSIFKLEIWGEKILNIENISQFLIMVWILSY